MKETLDDSYPFLKCINDNFLIQHAGKPTRGKNILDLVFTSEENMIENLSIGEHFGTSDHQIIRWNMLAYKVIEKQIKSYKYNKGYYDRIWIRDEAGSINWNEIVTGNNVESDWSRLKLYFGKMQQVYAI